MNISAELEEFMSKDETSEPGQTCTTVVSKCNCFHACVTRVLFGNNQLPPSLSCLLCQRHNVSGAACNDVSLEAFWLRSICFNPFCSHMNTLSGTQTECIVFVTILPNSFV